MRSNGPGQQWAPTHWRFKAEGGLIFAGIRLGVFTCPQRAEQPVCLLGLPCQAAMKTTWWGHTEAVTGDRQDEEEYFVAGTAQACDTQNSQHECEDRRLISIQTLRQLLNFSGFAWLIPLSLTACSYPPIFDPHALLGQLLKSSSLGKI